MEERDGKIFTAVVYYAGIASFLRKEGSWVLFSSSVFLAVFLPCVLFGYHVLLHGRRGAQNVFLLLSSLFFYWWGEPKFVVIMALSIVMNYLFGLWTAAFRVRGKKLVAPIACTVTANLAILFTFKYFNFFYICFVALY